MSTATWWRQTTPIGDITVVVGGRGVRGIAFSDEHVEYVIGDATPGTVRSIHDELDEWFLGGRKDFEVDVDLRAVGAPFATTVLETLRRDVGWGETVSYGELAAMAGSPKAARAVGSAMRNNPVPFVVPCHRVVAAGGRIGGYGGTSDGATANLAIKRWLLVHEGVLLPTG